MSWGDSWGDSPSSMARELALAFYDGRARTRAKHTYVEVDERSFSVYYVYNSTRIARHTPKSMIPLMVAHKLETGEEVSMKPLMFRVGMYDRGCARHLKALGLDARWQYGNKPILVHGADTKGHWYTIEEFKELPKWVEPKPVQKTRRVKFVNLTQPLFG